MSNENHCGHCGASLTNKRKDALYCCAAHRAAQWRVLQARPTSIRILLTRGDFLTLKNSADSLGVMINELIVARSLQSEVIPCIF